jgi:hypothetical protein
MNETRMLKDHYRTIRGSFTIICPDDTSFLESQEEIAKCLRGVLLPKGYHYVDTNTNCGWLERK